MEIWIENKTKKRRHPVINIGIYTYTLISIRYFNGKLIINCEMTGTDFENNDRFVDISIDEFNKMIADEKRIKEEESKRTVVYGESDYC